MKKTILLSVLFMALFTFSACNNDDDEAPFIEDPMVGDWVLSEYYINDTQIALPDCDGITKMYFEANGDFTSEVYSIFDGECKVGLLYNGNWISDGDSYYTVTIDGNSSTTLITFEEDLFYYTAEANDLVYKYGYKRI